jgi:hypothetical protein
MFLKFKTFLIFKMHINNFSSKKVNGVPANVKEDKFGGQNRAIET